MKLKKLLLVSCAALAVVSIILFYTSSTHSIGDYECFGWSACDDDPAQHCATRDEFQTQSFSSSYCDYNVCVSVYRITCHDLDDNGTPYTVYVTCRAYDSWNCSDW